MILPIDKFVVIMTQMCVWSGPHQNYAQDLQIVDMEIVPQIKGPIGIVQMALAHIAASMIQPVKHPKII